jgi:chromosome segregation ATPase
VSEPNLEHRSALVVDRSRSNINALTTRSNHTDSSLASAIYSELKAIDEGVEALSKQQRQDLLKKLLAQEISLSPPPEEPSTSLFEQTRIRKPQPSERIGQLEQALEQCLGYLNELRQKLRDQQMLETHLASVEEVANLQQKAVNELRHRLGQQHFWQMQLEQARLELQHERDRYSQAEQQTAMLQEQILQQSQQAGEYEVALQYWKTRYLESLAAIDRLKAALDPLLPPQATEILEIEKAIKSLKNTEAKPSSKKPANSVDLPPFLQQKCHP